MRFQYQAFVYAALTATSIAGPIAEPGPDETTAAMRRDIGHSLKNCGDGNGKWIPVAVYQDLVEKFCTDAVGHFPAQHHEFTDTYDVTQSDGDDGHVLFSIHNDNVNPAYVPIYNDCTEVFSEFASSDNTCYGKNNNDVRGGVYNVDGVGTFEITVWDGFIPGHTTPIDGSGSG